MQALDELLLLLLFWKYLYSKKVIWGFNFPLHFLRGARKIIIISLGNLWKQGKSNYRHQIHKYRSLAHAHGFAHAHVLASRLLTTYSKYKCPVKISNLTRHVFPTPSRVESIPSDTLRDEFGPVAPYYIQWVCTICIYSVGLVYRRMHGINNQHQVWCQKIYERVSKLYYQPIYWCLVGISSLWEDLCMPKLLVKSIPF